MAHAIEAVNGVHEMFSGNNVVPWHGLGQVVAGLLTAKEAIEAAHLGWNVRFAALSVGGREIPMEEWQATTREDNGAVLGITKGRYNIIQNSEVFDFADSLVADGELRYETAGALRGGKQVWMLAKYDGELEIAGDKHNQWLLLVTSHDGSKCLECCWVTERVVCANTLSIALRGKKNSIKIRHSSAWEGKRDEAKRVLGLTKDYFGDMREQLSRLQDRPMTAEDMEAFTRLLYPVKGEGEKGVEVPTRTSNMRWGTARLFNRGAGNKGQSAWDALNATTDFADHQFAMRGQTTRLESSLMGSAAELKQKAFDLLTGEELTAQLIGAKAFAPTPQTAIAASLASGASSDFARLLGA